MVTTHNPHPLAPILSLLFGKSSASYRNYDGTKRVLKSMENSNKRSRLDIVCVCVCGVYFIHNLGVYYSEIASLLKYIWNNFFPINHIFH